MGKIIFSILISLLFAFQLSAQSLDGIKICIDPGHGGMESDDRYIAATGFWESVSNLDKAFYLRDMLEDLGATVILTREGNDGTLDDPSLSQRVAIANSNNVDHMHSIHSNGYDGTRNSTLMLFQGFDNDPTFDAAKDMGAIMGLRLYQTNRTTSWSNRGDFDFYGTGQPYLGIFRNLTMPGTLSEGSFHDYIPESWRLVNTDYRKNEAWAIARSFLAFFNAGTYGTGYLAGIVRDQDRIVSYYYIPSTNDAKAPLNQIKVTLTPGNRIYQGDTKNNGFFLFDSLTPGSYKLVYECTGYFKDSTNVTVVANTVVFADKYLVPFAPEVPIDIRVLGNGTNSLRVVCGTAARASGYRVLYGLDADALTDSVSSQNPEIVINGLENNQVYYIRVRSFNSTGSSGLSKYLYAGVPSESDHSVLIVNGFDRGTNTRFDYIREYAVPVNDRGYAFSYVLNESVENGSVLLPSFKNVLWILGDESTADETFSSHEQELVTAFLKGGGNLFVSGSEIGWDLGRSGFSSAADIDFYQNYLKAEYVADAPLDQSATYYAVEPVAGSFFDGLDAFNFDDGTHGTIDVDWPDAIRAINGAVNILQFTGVALTNGGAGVAYEGKFPGGRVPGRLIYLSFPFETIYPVEPRIAVMSRVFDFFEGQYPLAVPTPEQQVAQDFSLLQNYPNPFNPSTTIKFRLPESRKISLIVYNLLGEKVRILIDNASYTPGTWEVSWDGLDYHGRQVASGVYIYRLTGPDIQLSRKMMLIR